MVPLDGTNRKEQADNVRFSSAVSDTWTWYQCSVNVVPIGTPSQRQ